jgi:hypothetical protein
VSDPRGRSEAEPKARGRIPARVSFVTLAVRDFARMAKFYRQSLGEAPAAGSFKGFELAKNLDGIRLLSEPKDLSIGCRAFSFLDPEDNAWEVIWKSGTSFDERGGLIFP